jgi:hypothetical protein
MVSKKRHLACLSKIEWVGMVSKKETIFGKRLVSKKGCQRLTRRDFQWKARLKTEKE